MTNRARPYRLCIAGEFSARTFATEQAARDAVGRYVKPGEHYRIEIQRTRYGKREVIFDSRSALSQETEG